MNEDKYWSMIIDLFEFAYINRVTFHPIQDITKKVKIMVDSNRSCICRNERTCPCKEAIIELSERGKCTCMLFSTYKYGDEYLNKYGYILNGKVTSDLDRKKIVKEEEINLNKTK